jgi:very-short-patch-repair endonuclease
MRTADLARKGYHVLRFWNSQVLNDLDEVIRVIKEKIVEKRLV